MSNINIDPTITKDTARNVRDYFIVCLGIPVNAGRLRELAQVPMDCATGEECKSVIDAAEVLGRDPKNKKASEALYVGIEASEILTGEDLGPLVESTEPRAIALLVCEAYAFWDVERC